jgi:enamine deaminase RidA (YjgF/YER057c/UK114 family)
MIQRSIEVHSAYTIYVTAIHNQTFLSISITQSEAGPKKITEEIYKRVAELLTASSSQIVHERCFADTEQYQTIVKARQVGLGKQQNQNDIPITFVDGKACSKNAIAGFQIRALQTNSTTAIRTIFDEGIPKGRAWESNGSTFYILQSIDGDTDSTTLNRNSQTDAMFRQTERILRNEGASYQDVVRTWIYISDILEWYDNFNKVRNLFYSEIGFLNNGTAQNHAEQIFLPASTGIEGKNPSKTPATMDIFAVHHFSANTTKVRPLYGSKQRSPYRYGSAFSRAVVIEEVDSTMILVSGTASIDEEGRSVFIGDTAAQIQETLNVISELIAPEGATLQDLCEATVFLKRQEDFIVYQNILKKMGLSNIPSVNVVADVCRDELLFEIDAAFILEKGKA